MKSQGFESFNSRRAAENFARKKEKSGHVVGVYREEHFVVEYAPREEKVEGSKKQAKR